MDANAFKTLLASSDNIVFFGGAGVSTESGIPDFRSASGLYHEHSASDHTPEEMLSHDFFMEHNRSILQVLSKQNHSCGCKAECRTSCIGQT